MIPNTEKNPILLEQANAIVKAIKPTAIYEELDKRKRCPPGYTLRFQDLQNDLAREVAYETLARTCQSSTASRDTVDALVAVLDQRGLTRDLTERGMETLCDELRTVLEKAQREPG